MSPIAFDQAVAETLLRYAKLIVARGYVHNSLGNLAIRVPHADFPYGVAYTKHAEVSLEEMTLRCMPGTGLYCSHLTASCAFELALTLGTGDSVKKRRTIGVRF